MTDRKINLFYAKYLGIFYSVSSEVFVTHINESMPRAFDVVTDANDRDLVFDKLVKEGWRFEYYNSVEVVMICGNNELQFKDYVQCSTTKEANRAVLEKIMNKPTV